MGAPPPIRLHPERQQACVRRPLYFGIILLPVFALGLCDCRPVHVSGSGLWAAVAGERRCARGVQEQRGSPTHSRQPWGDEIHAVVVVRRPPNVGSAHETLDIPIGNAMPRLPEHTPPRRHKDLVPCVHTACAHASGAVEPFPVELLTATLAVRSVSHHRRTQTPQRGAAKLC